MDRCRAPDSSTEELADGAWQLTTCAPPGHPAIEILACLFDPPTLTSTGADTGPEHGPLERHAALRFLLSDVIQRLLPAARGILRVLSRGPHEDHGDGDSQVESDGHMAAGLVDWSGTLIRRMASGGQRTAVIMRRPEAQRDLPKHRLLRFLLLETERRAKLLSHAPAIDATLHARMLRLASRAATLAHHPLLETVPPGPSRAGLRDAARSPFADDRVVARAYELHEALWGRGSREVLLDIAREALRSDIPDPYGAAALAFIRAVDVARSLVESAPLTVRPLPARRGLVAACRLDGRTIEVTLDKRAPLELAIQSTMRGVTRQERIRIDEENPSVWQRMALPT